MIVTRGYSKVEDISARTNKRSKPFKLACMLQVQIDYDD